MTATILLALALGLQLHAPSQAPALEPAPSERVPTHGWSSEVFTLRSEVLGETLELYVGKPPSYERSRRALPVLYLLDGQHYFAEVLGVLASLAAHGHVPELLLIGIESRDRRVDFTPAGIYLPDVEERARAASYLDFLERELAPAAESRLRAGRPRVLLGHSHAAMLGLHAVAERPAAFPFVVAIDAPTHHEGGLLANELARALASSERPPVRVVSTHVVFGWSDEQWARLQAAARPGDLLTHDFVPGESHESMLVAATYKSLHELFADASMLRMHALPPLEIDALYRGLAPLYGTEVAPPEPLMRRMVEDFLMEGRGTQAGKWLERYTDTYGEPADHAALVARIVEVSALGEPTETVAELLALPRATPEEMKQHLGRWEGETRRGDARSDGLTVDFRVVDGVVEGSVQHAGGGPPHAVEYLRFRPDGALEFGYRNGMRPRGLIVYSEAVAGGPLEGESVFRGIRFVPPPGHTLPVVRFELRR